MNLLPNVSRIVRDLAPQRQRHSMQGIAKKPQAHVKLVTVRLS